MMNNTTTTALHHYTLLKNPTIKCFLHKVERSNETWNRAIEAVAAYGILCLSRNFPMKLLSVEDIEEITDDLRPPAQRLKSKARKQKKEGSLAKTLAASHNKPSSNWRIGEDIHLANAEPLGERFEPQPLEADELIQSVKSTEFGKMISSVLGEDFLSRAAHLFVALSTNGNTMAKAIAQTGQQLLTSATASPSPQLDVDFDGFLRQCVREKLNCTVQQTPQNTPQTFPDTVHSKANSKRTIGSKPQAATFRPNRKPVADENNSARGNIMSRPVAAKEIPQDIRRRKGTDPRIYKGTPVYLRNVQSRIKTDLQAAKDAQRVNDENRRRLAEEYVLRSTTRERSEETRDSMKPEGSGRKIGLTARQIADSFLQGPLMQELAADGNGYATGATVEIRPSSRQSEEPVWTEGEDMQNIEKLKQPKGRAFTQWVGEFGPSHTRRSTARSGPVELVGHHDDTSSSSSDEKEGTDTGRPGTRYHKSARGTTQGGIAWDDFDRNSSESGSEVESVQKAFEEELGIPAANKSISSEEDLHSLKSLLSDFASES